jgi:excisionase family DNA binding protein
MATLIDGPQLAKQLGIPDKTVAEWRSVGRGPSYIKVGRHVRYRQEDVDAWLEANTTRPGNAA